MTRTCAYDHAQSYQTYVNACRDCAVYLDRSLPMEFE
jgi:hypothetical protein